MRGLEKNALGGDTIQDTYGRTSRLLDRIDLFGENLPRCPSDSFQVLDVTNTGTMARTMWFLAVITPLAPTSKEVFGAVYSRLSQSRARRQHRIVFWSRAVL